MRTVVQAAVGWVGCITHGAEAGRSCRGHEHSDSAELRKQDCTASAVYKQ